MLSAQLMSQTHTLPAFYFVIQQDLVTALPQAYSQLESTPSFAAVHRGSLRQIDHDCVGM